MQKEAMWVVSVECRIAADTDNGERLLEQLDSVKVVGLAKDIATAVSLAAREADCSGRYEWKNLRDWPTLEDLTYGDCKLWENELGMVIVMERLAVGERQTFFSAGA